MSLLSRWRGARAGGVAAAVDDAAADDGRLLAEAMALARGGRFGDALRRIDDDAAGKAGNAHALFARGSVLLEWGRMAEAVAHLQAAEAKGLRSPVLDLTMGWAFLRGGDGVRAEACLRRVIEAQHEPVQAHFALGIALHAQQRLVDAEAAFEFVLACEPGHVDSLIRVGNCRLERQDPVGAEEAFRRAIAADHRCAAAYNDLSVALHRQDQHDDAIVASQTAAGLEDAAGVPGECFVNLAVGLADDGKVAEALAVYERCLPWRGFPNGYYGYGLALLTAGRLAEGWRYAEFRWLIEPLVGKRIASTRPVWAGQDLAGKTLLLRAEQGIGDTIQFLRYAPALKALGATVLLKVQDGFEAFARGFPGVDRVLDAAPAPVEFDYYVHPMSLPGVFGTDLATVPAPVAYLAPEPECVTQWTRRVGPGPSLRVGLVWAGNPTHLRDRFRSLALAQLAPLADVPGVRFFSLQKGQGAQDAAKPPAGFALDDLGPELSDFRDTAAAIAALDLVISVDTSVAHLAGALGRPVWMLVPRPADWRWLQEGETSPWYPTMRLFRQRTRDDWADVIARVRDALLRAARAPGGLLPARSPTGAEAVATPALPAPCALPPRPGFAAVAETRFGILQYMPDEPGAGTGTGTGTAVGYYGEVQQRVVNLLAGLLRPGATVVEAGSGIGAHALALSRIVGADGRLFLYESAPPTRQILQRNLAANRVRNALLMRAGLGRSAQPEGPLETVDDLALPALHLLKIAEDADVAGIVAGAEQTLWRLRPTIFAAARDEATVTSLAAQVEGFGYRRWRVETPLFNPDNFNRRTDDAFGGRTALALLAIPEEAAAEIDAAACVELR